jgi:hypothetical protein
VVDNVTEKLPPNVLHELLFCIRTHFNLTISQKKSLLLALQRLYPEADSVPSLRPLLFSFEDLGTKRYVRGVPGVVTVSGLHGHLRLRNY